MVFSGCCKGWYAVVGDLVKDVYNVVVISPAELDTYKGGGVGERER